MPKEKQDQKSPQIHIKDFFFEEADLKTKNRVLRAIFRKIFNRPAKKRRMNFGKYSVDFSGTELRWHSNLMTKIYRRYKTALPCFFTFDGAMFVLFYVKGNPDAIEPLQFPEAIEEYVEGREKEQQKKKKSLTIDKESIKEEIINGEYHLEYEGHWKKRGHEVELFEHTVALGIDKVVLRASVPEKADSRARADLAVIAKSLHLIQ